MDIRVRLWTDTLEGWAAFGVSFSRWFTIFSICSIDLDSFFSIRSAWAESFGLDGTVCNEQSDGEEDSFGSPSATEAGGFAPTEVEPGPEATARSASGACSVLWGSFCSAWTGVVESSDCEESSIHWICCWAAASSSRLLLSRACKLQLVRSWLPGKRNLMHLN